MSDGFIPLHREERRISPSALYLCPVSRLEKDSLQGQGSIQRVASCTRNAESTLCNVGCLEGTKFRCLGCKTHLHTCTLPALLCLSVCLSRSSLAVMPVLQPGQVEPVVLFTASLRAWKTLEPQPLGSQASLILFISLRFRSYPAKYMCVWSGPAPTSAARGPAFPRGGHYSPPSQLTCCR